MLTLHHNEMSTCSQKVRLTLEEKNLEWQSIHLKLREGEQFDSRYLRLNPRGVVPTLIHEDHVIRESSVILEYLDEVFPEPSLHPDDSVTRATMRLWTKQFDEDLQTSTAIVSMCIAFRHQFLEKSADEMETYLQKLPTPARRKGIMSLIESGTSLPQFETAIRRYDTLFTDMEAALTHDQWLAGDTYSLADISYTPYLTRFEHLHLLGMLATRPRLRDWYERVKQRPSYRTAMTKWESPAYFELYNTKAPQEWSRVQAILQV